MTDTYDLRVLSLGAGVQSSAVLLMALDGIFGPLPDCAIFADTQWEPQEVYAHLDRLEDIAGDRIPIHRVTAGNLRADVLAAVDSTTGVGRIGQPPFFVKNTQTQKDMPPVSGGMLWRKCSREYKIDPIERKIRNLLGYRKGQRVKKRVQSWIGISIDEAHRMKDSRTPWIDKYYPLIEHRLSRADCLRWLRDKGYSTPRKSACIGCPFHSNAVWVDMKNNRPDEWLDVVAFDADLRKGKLPGCTGDAYVHRAMLPIEEAVRLNQDENQLDLFGQECEGICGV